MKLAQNIKTGAWLLVALNLMMAFGAIGVFVRMAPAIDIILEQNEKSLYACQEMLANLTLGLQDKTGVGEYKLVFEQALERANNNITEKDEPEAIEMIQKSYVLAFQGDSSAIKDTVSAITMLSQVNRDAMFKANRKARQIGNSGAWGIVFMSTTVFLVAMVFISKIMHNLILPVEEIYNVIIESGKGERYRRCVGRNAPKEIQIIYSGINDILDNKSSFVSHD